MNTCPNCNSPMIPGIFPGSAGWCKAECDLNKSPTAKEDGPYWTFAAVSRPIGWESPSNVAFTASKGNCIEHVKLHVPNSETFWLLRVEPIGQPRHFGLKHFEYAGRIRVLEVIPFTEA